ncbi:hypothetical protein [Pseudophaeobacter sp. EL27]|uniref:hypothetical protein n=1 Tax=Pseudophaeobacter sp. EL27 TaxID=2107580 RepID=UPI0013C524E5|nr:hypothetical protein [Pseudophaeobacter sp. EL27]
MTRTGFEKFRLSHRDRALFLIENEQNYEAQLLAIKGALSRNKEAENEFSKGIQHMREQLNLLDPEDNTNADHFIDHLTDMFHESVYFDAAHSMAAVGMLAPYFESLFVSLFGAIRRETQKVEGRKGRSKAFQDFYWNPQIVMGSNEPRTNLVEGITDLAAETGLLPHLPEGYETTLKALFSYRNNMFHNGFEWPVETRKKFQKRIDNKHWPKEWFEKSTKDDEPWIFYMSEEFIQHCLSMIDHVLVGAGEFFEDLSSS